MVRGLTEKVFLVLLVIGFLFRESGALAWTLELGPDVRLGITAYLQARARFAEGEAPDGRSWSKDFYLRRVRLILTGDLSRHLSFVVHTEQADFGKGGRWDVAFFLSDAFGTLRVREEFQIDVGRMLTPPGRQHFGSSSRLHGMDFQSPVIRWAPGSQHNGRATGVQVRGDVLGGRLGYRMGVFRGASSRPLQQDATGQAVSDRDGRPVLVANPSSWPRVAGYLRYSPVGVEKGFYSVGLHFADQPIVSLGAGFDVQPRGAMNRPAVLGPDGQVTVPGSLGTAWAVAADLFADIPVGAARDQEFVGLLLVSWYDHGRELAWDAGGAARTVPARTSGLGIAGEFGWRWRFLEPVVSLDWVRGRQRGTDSLALRPGFNFWIRKHAANVKVEVEARRDGDLRRAPWRKRVELQVQLIF